MQTEKIFSAAAVRLKPYRTVLFSALVFGCLAHMFQLTNKIANHDDIFNLFSLGSTLPSGRWGLHLLAKLLTTISLPWLNGVCSLLLVTAAVCFITDIFSIKNKLLQKLITGQWCEAKVFRAGVAGVLLLGASFFLYWGILQIFLRTNQIVMSSYATDAVSISGAGLVQNVLKSYTAFSGYFVNGSRGLIPSAFSRTVHIGCALLLLAEIVFQYFQVKRAAFRLLLLFLVSILPLSINCMYLLFQPVSIHTLVLYSISSIYVLAAVIIQHGLNTVSETPWQNKCRAFLFDLIVFSMSVVIAVNTYTANAVYFRLHLRQENTSSFCTSVATHLQDIPGYTPNTEVVIAGDYPSPGFFGSSFEDVQKIAGAQGLTPDVYSLKSVFYHYLGLNVNIVSGDEKYAVTETQEFSEMPSYPAGGYIRMIGDTVVIKLSDIR